MRSEDVLEPMGEACRVVHGFDFAARWKTVCLKGEAEILYCDEKLKLSNSCIAGLHCLNAFSRPFWEIQVLTRRAHHIAASVSHFVQASMTGQDSHRSLMYSSTGSVSNCDLSPI